MLSAMLIVLVGVLLAAVFIGGAWLATREQRRENAVLKRRTDHQIEVLLAQCERPWGDW